MGGSYFSFRLIACFLACACLSAVGFCEIALEVNSSRVVEQLQALALISDASPPAVTRVLYTEHDVEARAFLQGIIAEAGLSFRVDAIGNIFARWASPDSDAGVVGTGSHYDAIPFSGMYDGTLGVLGAIEAVRALRDSGFRPRKSLEILAFTSEEPTRFQLSCIGSRALVGQKSAKDLVALSDDDGVSFEEARKGAGFSGDLGSVKLPNGYFDAFVELHIEQGKRLEAGAMDIGVVTAIAGPETAEVVFEGSGGHAGGMLMRDRNDAVLAGAEFTLAVEAAVLETKSEDTVATTGSFLVEPGLENSIGRVVRVSLDARDTVLSRRDRVLAAARAAVTEISGRRRVKGVLKTRSADAPASSDLSIIAAVANSAKKLGYKYEKLVSRAYHDSLLMASMFPTGMIFVPCRDGVSHHPTEFTSEAQIEKGIRTLALTLSELAGGQWKEEGGQRGTVHDEL